MSHTVGGDEAAQERPADGGADYDCAETEQDRAEGMMHGVCCFWRVPASMGGAFVTDTVFGIR